jgi:GNAT superfamily N-acetyltransferase
MPLQPEQFNDIRPHGERYVLHAAGRTIMHAYPVTKGPEGEIVHPTDRAATKKPVASLTWFGGTPTEADLQTRSNTTPGTIYKAIVKPAHQRKGIATAMLNYARELHPESQIRHSGALSPEGQAWAERTP